LTDAQWQQMARYSQRRIDDGNLSLAYDPAIVQNVKLGVADVDLWALWDRITCPVLVLRGADSDILSPETAQSMTERGPRAELITFAGVGHAPALMAKDQIDIVTGWLTKTI
jgi:pimeloyl-ACP methyl ester carboxylesterase